MRLKNYFIGAFLVGSLSACHPIRKIKNNLRSLISGNRQEAAAEKIQRADEDLSTDYTQFKASQEVDKITPRTKTINLMRAYNQAQDKTYLPYLVKAIEENGSIFGEKRDAELLSFIYGLGNFIENSSEEALDITYLWYLKLSGHNKVETAKVLSLAFDYMPELIFSKFGRELQKEDCKLIYFAPPRMSEKVDQKTYLQARVETLSELLAGTSMTGSLYNLVADCNQKLSLFVRSL